MAGRPLGERGKYYRLGIAWYGRLSLEKVASCAVTILATVLPAVPASGADISLKCTGSTLEAYVDGVLKATVDDSTHAGTSFGIQAWNAAAIFRNFRVWKI